MLWLIGVCVHFFLESEKKKICDDSQIKATVMKIKQKYFKNFCIHIQMDKTM